MQLDMFYFGGWLGGREKPSRQRRPADPRITWRDKRIAAHSLLLELEDRDSSAAQGKRPNFKDVIYTLKKLYRVNRSIIFSARKRWCPKLRKLGYDQLPPEHRRWWLGGWSAGVQRKRETHLRPHDAHARVPLAFAILRWTWSASVTALTAMKSARGRGCERFAAT